MKKFFGKNWQTWIEEYSKSHQHPINQRLHTIGIPLILISLLFLGAGFFSYGILKLGIGLFIFGWILQFVGHIYERKWPEFFHDWRFLFVGARWWWSKAFKNASNKP